MLAIGFMRRMFVAGSVLALLLMALPAMADDVLPPDWRGQQNTITAGWDQFSPTGIGPGQQIIPGNMLDTEPQGAFDGLLIGGVASWNSGCWVYQNYNGRQGVIEVNPGTGLGPVSIGLVNFDFPNPEKKIRLQITFQGTGVMDFYVTSGPGSLPDPVPFFPWTKYDAVVSESYDHGDGWQTSAYDIILPENPGWENIMLDWGYNTGPQTWACWIDQIVIDTQCVPEPASLCLLSLGGLALLIRRRV